MVGEEIAALGLEARCGAKGGKGMLDSIQLRLAREEGQALVEYALIVSLVAIVTVSVLSLIGTNLVDIFNGAAGSL
jgi:Flp pilus assembly pilin Flp